MTALTRQALTRRAGLLAAVSLAAATIVAVPAVPATASAAATAAGPGQTVVGWGSNTDGELGDGTTTDASLPVFAELPARLRYTTVRSSLDTSVALATSGAVFAWGSNIYGQVGDGTTTPRLTPVRVTLPKGVEGDGGARRRRVHHGADGHRARSCAWGNNCSRASWATAPRKTSRCRCGSRLPKGVTVTAISAGYRQRPGADQHGPGAVLGRGTVVGQLGDGNDARPSGWSLATCRMPRHTKISLHRGRVN